MYTEHSSHCEGHTSPHTAVYVCTPSRLGMHSPSAQLWTTLGFSGLRMGHTAPWCALITACARGVALSGALPNPPPWAYAPGAGSLDRLEEWNVEKAASVKPPISSLRVMTRPPAAHRLPLGGTNHAQTRPTPWLASAAPPPIVLRHSATAGGFTSANRVAHLEGLCAIYQPHRLPQKAAKPNARRCAAQASCPGA